MGILDTSAPAEAVEADIARSRERLGALLDELNRRRHDLFDVRLQLRRHALSFALAAGAVVALAAAVIGTAVRRRRRRRRLVERVRRRLLGRR